MDPRTNKAAKVFLDTNFLVGLYAISDSLHEKSLAISAKLSKLPVAKLYISNYVLAEALTVLSQRAGKKISITSGKKIIESGYFTILQHDIENNGLSWKLFRQITNKDISFVDTAIIKVMEQEGINLLITFDAELAKLAKSHKIKVLH